MAAPPPKKQAKRAPRHAAGNITFIGGNDAALAVQLGAAPVDTWVVCRKAGNWVPPSLADDVQRFFSVGAAPRWWPVDCIAHVTSLDSRTLLASVEVEYGEKAKQGRDWFIVPTHVGRDGVWAKRAKWDGQPKYHNNVWMSHAALCAVVRKTLTAARKKPRPAVSQLDKAWAYYLGGAALQHDASVALGAAAFPPPSTGRRRSAAKIDVVTQLEARWTARLDALPIGRLCCEVLYPMAVRELQLSGLSGRPLATKIKEAFDGLPVDLGAVSTLAREAESFDDATRAELEGRVASVKTLLRRTTGLRDPVEGETLAAYLRSLLAAPTAAQQASALRNNARPIARALATYQLARGMKAGPTAVVRANNAFRDIAEDAEHDGGVEFHEKLISSSPSQASREFEFVDRGIARLQRCILARNNNVALSIDGGSVAVGGGRFAHFHAVHVCGVVPRKDLPPFRVPGFALQAKRLAARAAKRDVDFSPAGRPPGPPPNEFAVYREKNFADAYAAETDVSPGLRRVHSTLRRLGGQWADASSPDRRDTADAFGAQKALRCAQAANHQKRRKTWGTAQSALRDCTRAMRHPCQPSLRQYRTALEVFAQDATVDGDDTLPVHVMGLRTRWDAMDGDARKPYADKARAERRAYEEAAARATLITEDMEKMSLADWTAEAVAMGLAPPPPPVPPPPRTTRVDVRAAEELMLRILAEAAAGSPAQRAAAVAAARDLTALGDGPCDACAVFEYPTVRCELLTDDEEPVCNHKFCYRCLRKGLEPASLACPVCKASYVALGNDGRGKKFELIKQQTESQAGVRATLATARPKKLPRCGICKAAGLMCLEHNAGNCPLAPRDAPTQQQTGSGYIRVAAQLRANPYAFAGDTADALASAAMRGPGTVKFRI